MKRWFLILNIKNLAFTNVVEIRCQPTLCEVNLMALTKARIIDCDLFAPYLRYSHEVKSVNQSRQLNLY